MCAINLIFDYNVIINTIVLAVFLLAFSIFIYSIKLKISLFYVFIIPCMVIATEFSAVSIVSAILGSDTYDFLEDPYVYILIILICKSLLFFALKLIGDIFNRYHQDKNIEQRDF